MRGPSGADILVINTLFGQPGLHQSMVGHWQKHVTAFHEEVGQMLLLQSLVDAVP